MNKRHIEERQEVEKSTRALSVFGGAVILCCAILVGLDVVLRDIFNISVIFSFEITEYANAFAMSLAFADALYAKRHIRIDVLYNKFSRDAKAIFDVLAIVGVTLIACFLAYQATRLALDSFEIGATSKSTLAVPMFIPQGLWSAALIWFAVVSGYLLIRSFALLVQRRTAQVHEEIGVLSHESPDI